MSYDYGALVSKLAEHRALVAEANQKSDAGAGEQKLEQLQEALQIFEELSDRCPMTPLLWMQYAYDMSELMKSISSGDKESSANTEATALQARLQTLELALNEFPGSAILHLHYCELALSVQATTMDSSDKIQQTENSLTKALQQVGAGSHRNEGELVAQLYRIFAHFVATYQKDHKTVLQSFLQRAQTPIKEANDTLKEEVQEFCQKHNISVNADFQQQLEDARRFEAKAYSKLISFEDDVDLSMHQEQISYSDFMDLSSFTAAEDSDDLFMTTTPQFTSTVLRGHLLDQQYWNGLGAAATATAFLKYATAARKFQFPTDTEEDRKELKRQQCQLVINVYERGIAECPTVESVWLAYLKHMVWLWNHDLENAPTAQTLKTITVRAVRNCPFSLALVQHQLQTALLLANREDSEHVMDPEELLEVVTKALDSKFLPTPAQALDLYMTAIRSVQRRVLTIVSTSVMGYEPTSKSKQATVLKYDDAELLPANAPKQANNKKNNDTNNNNLTAPPLDDEAWQEVQDLCEEIRDMFDAANSRLHRDHASWTEGRAWLRHEWAQTEQLVLTPLLAASNTETEPPTSNGNNQQNTTLLAHYEKVVRLHNPSHPDAYRALIQHVFHHGTTQGAGTRSPGEVVSRLRQVRGLYQKAIQSVGKPKHKDPAAVLQTTTTSIAPRDFETAMANLCYEYQEFERTFGSDQSLADATRLMQKKLQKTTRHAQHKSAQDVEMEDAGNSRGKRKASNADESHDGDNAAHPAKKLKTDNAANNEGTKSETGVQPQPKPKPPKVKIGHIFHKAHPFTIRISNLAVETQEMDLVETFRHGYNCGSIVHVKIMREKPLHAKGHEAKVGISRGWGLLQFEERESVEKALELDGIAEIHGRKIKVERSHVPAVGIVPPGMHRPGAKQQKKKGPAGGSEPVNAEEAKGPEDTKKKSSNNSSFGVLAFRPRGVVQKKQPAGPKKSHPKVKLAVPSAKKDDSTDE